MIDSNVDDSGPPEAPKARYLTQFRPNRSALASSRVAYLRQRYTRATRADDIRKIWRRVLEMAKDGDRWAVEFVFMRLFGPPVAVDYVQKLEELQRAMNGETPELREFTVLDQEERGPRWESTDGS